MLISRGNYHRNKRGLFFTSKLFIRKAEEEPHATHCHLFVYPNFDLDHQFNKETLIGLDTILTYYKLLIHWLIFRLGQLEPYLLNHV